ncbi:MAG: AraC family ligand binding domain-containing protein [Hymenobacter sp.]
MIANESLTDFHQAYLPRYAAAVPPSFSVHAIAPSPEPPVVPYSRRDFYQINLFTSGTARLEHAGEHLLITAPALVLHNPLVPYACAAQTPLTGFFCLFTADFCTGQATRPRCRHRRCCNLTPTR